MTCKQLHRSTVTLGMALMPLVVSAATEVYSQPPGTTLINTSAVYNVPSDPGFTWSLDQDEELWAYFSVPADITFSRIAWYGSDTDGVFALDFFAASCFTCGINFVGTNGLFANSALPNPGPFSQSQVHKTPVSGSLYSYYVDLTTPLTLNHATGYALSVVNNYSALPFAWAGSSVGRGSYAQYIVGQAMVLAAPGNLAFTLIDTTSVPDVPPTWKLAAGTLALFVQARRRRPTV